MSVANANVGVSVNVAGASVAGANVAGANVVGAVNVAANAKGAGNAKAAKPAAGNTGPSNAALMKACGSMTVTTDGAVIGNVSVTGTIYIAAANVSISNFKIDADGDYYGVQVLSGGSVTLSDGEIINAASGAVFGNNWTAQRLNVHEMGSDAFDGGGHNTLESCWIHHIGKDSGAHADGFQSVNGDHIVIKGNHFEIPWWQQSGKTIYRSNACIFLNGSLHNYLDGTLIEGNWFNGGNYSIYALDQTNTTVSGNHFAKGYQYGIMTGEVAVWSGNMDGDGKAVNK